MCALCEVLNHNRQQRKRCNNETINHPRQKGSQQMLKVENMKSPATGRKVANQFILTDTENNRVTFQSYDSMIAEIDSTNRVITLGVDYRYSATTSKYRNEFFKNELFQSLAMTELIEDAIKAGETQRDGTGKTYKVVLLDE